MAGSTGETSLETSPLARPRSSCNSWPGLIAIEVDQWILMIYEDGSTIEDTEVWINDDGSRLLIMAVTI